MPDSEQQNKRKSSHDVRPGRSKVTLREIADAAGVSISTASRAMSGAPGISEAVRQKIQSTAERLNFGEQSGSACEITVLTMVDVDVESEHFMQGVMTGIRSQCQQFGITPTISMVGSGMALPPHRSDSDEPVTNGYVLLSFQDESLIQRLTEDGYPAIIINGIDALMRLDAVAPANRMGGYIAVRHLLERGHRRILNLTFSQRLTIRDRQAGYHKGLKDAGIEVDDDLVVELDAMRTEAAYSAVKARLQARGGADFTAIQCCNDGSAFGATAAIQEAGLRIPEDISIIGFDDVPTAAMAACPLTTIHVDREKIGAWGLRRLLERIKHPDMTETYTEFAVRLVERGSTGPAK
ncbi:LacI family DNA-binding transcriptional regulator [Gynuella sp.]|uniref:LacI family DNA-binding transcriptional regulator n=1 Tax=Gynuella sp. TaxID=2969146 RepID=UPI003D0A3662